MVEERRRQEVFHQRMPQFSSFVALSPWDSVLKAAATDTAFWEKELKEPALLYTVGHGRAEPSWVEKQQPLPEAAGLSNRAAKRKRDADRKSEAQKQQNQPRQPEKGGKGNGKTGHPRKNKVGDYLTTRDGSQICFAWGRAHDGCKTPCPEKRAHVCQRCLQPHRTISCTAQGGGKPHM